MQLRLSTDNSLWLRTHFVFIPSWCFQNIRDCDVRIVAVSLSTLPALIDTHTQCCPCVRRAVNNISRLSVCLFVSASAKM